MHPGWSAGTAIICTALTVGRPEPTSFVTLAQRDTSASGEPTADVSADGRYVAFESCARLVEADADDSRDIYILDRITGLVTLETTDAHSRADYSAPRVSGDGRYLIYERVDDASDIVLRDRHTASTAVISAPSSGTESRGRSRDPDISDDGRLVVFASSARQLTAGHDRNDAGEDVYGVETQPDAAGALEIRRISLDNHGGQSSGGASFAPAVSANGRKIVFTSTAYLDSRVERRVRDDSGMGGPSQVFLRDLDAGSTKQISTRPGGRQPNGPSWGAAISADGRYVAFVSTATNLVPADRNRLADIFLVDLQDGSMLRVTRSPGGGDANGASARPSLSGDGRFVAFQSDASNLTCARRCAAGFEDLNLLWDVFVFDRTHRTMVRMSEDATGAWMEPSVAPRLSANGELLVFSSRHPTDAHDRKHDFDLFVRASQLPPPVSVAPRAARIASR